MNYTWARYIPLVKSLNALSLIDSIDHIGKNKLFLRCINKRISCNEHLQRVHRDTAIAVEIMVLRNIQKWSDLQNTLLLRNFEIELLYIMSYIQSTTSMIYKILKNPTSSVSTIMRRKKNYNCIMAYSCKLLNDYLNSSSDYINGENGKSVINWAMDDTKNGNANFIEL